VDFSSPDAGFSQLGSTLFGRNAHVFYKDVAGGTFASVTESLLFDLLNHTKRIILLENTPTSCNNLPHEIYKPSLGTNSYIQRWFASNLVFQFLLAYIVASFQTQLPQYVRVK